MKKLKLKTTDIRCPPDPVDPPGAIIKGYIGKSNSTNEDYNADLDLSLVRFTPELVTYLLQLKKDFDKTVARFGSLHSWSIGDSSALFFSYKFAKKFFQEKMVEDMMDFSLDGPHPVTYTRANVDWNVEGVETSESLEIHLGGFAWERYIDDGRATLCSDFTNWGWLTECRNCDKPKAEHAKGKCLFGSTTYAAKNS